MFRTIFFGTPIFTKPIVDSLLQSTDLVAIVTSPDPQRASGNSKSQNEWLKQLAKTKNIPLLQPTKFDKKTIKQLEKLGADFFIVVAYGQIMPEAVLTIPKIYPVNIHFSLLPKYRGAIPVQAALLNGDSKTGVTLQVMKPKLDSGPILWQRTIKILDQDNSVSLKKKLTKISQVNLVKILDKAAKSKMSPVLQNEKLATYCSIDQLKKKNGLITWQLSTWQTHNIIRAFYPDPMAYTIFSKGTEKLEINLLKSNFLRKIPSFLIDKNYQPGQTYTTKKQLFIRAKDHFLEILELQPFGRKVLSASNFINGYKKWLS